MSLWDRAGRAFVDERLLDILLPSGGFLKVFEAYFDESERTTAVFSVAGFAFAKSKVKRFNEQWRSFFADYGGSCHMTDLHARQRQFEGIDDEEAARLCIGAVKLINEYASFGAAVACDLNELKPRLPKGVIGYSHAYPMLCHHSMYCLGDLIGRARPSQPIAYIFESGHKEQAEAQKVMDLVDNSPELANPLRYYSHAFVPKKDAPALQAADLFAWEYAKYWDDSVRQKKIKMRKSIAAIFSHGRKTVEFQKRFKINFLTGPPLWDALEKAKALELLE